MVGFSGGGGLSEDSVLLLDGSNIMTGPIKTSDLEIQGQVSATVDPDTAFPGTTLPALWEEISDGIGGSVAVSSGKVRIDGNKAYNAYPQESIKSTWTITGDYDVRMEVDIDSLATGTVPRAFLQMIHVAEEGVPSSFTQYDRADHVACGLSKSGSTQSAYRSFINAVNGTFTTTGAVGTDYQWFQARIVRVNNDFACYVRWAATQGALPDLDDNTGWTLTQTAETFVPTREEGRCNIQVAANYIDVYEFIKPTGTAINDTVVGPMLQLTNLVQIGDSQELVQIYNGLTSDGEVLFVGSNVGTIGSPQGDSTEPVITLGGNQAYSTAPLLHVKGIAADLAATSDPEFEVQADGALNWPKAPQGDETFLIDPAGGQVKFLNGASSRGMVFNTTRMSLADRDFQMKAAGSADGTAGSQVYMEVGNSAYQIWLGGLGPTRGALRIGADTSAPARSGIIEMQDEGGSGHWLFIGPDDELRLHTSDPGEDDTSGKAIGPMAYGGMYVHGGAGSQTVSSGTPVKMTQFVSSMTSSGVTPDPTTDDDLTVLRPGIYLVGFQLSFSGSLSSTWHIHVRKNSVQVDDIGCTRKLGTGGDVGSCSAAGVVSLAANDVLTIYIEPDGASKDFDLNDGQLYVTQIG